MIEMYTVHKKTDILISDMTHFEIKILGLYRYYVKPNLTRSIRRGGSSRIFDLGFLKKVVFPRPTHAYKLYPLIVYISKS
jgi:hypothetical protein